MIASVLLLLLQSAPIPAPTATLPPPAYPAPPPAAIALGRQLAETGLLATLLPIVAAGEADELVAAHPELSPADQAALRRTAAGKLATVRARMMDAMARTYAERLSTADMTALIAAARSPAATRQRAAMPTVVAATVAAAGETDLEAETIAAFCASTGKACPTP